MRVVPNRKDRVQSATVLPRICTKPVEYVLGQQPRCCTGAYSRCTKTQLAAECSLPSGALP